jgi:hypothetical protein
LRKCARPRAGAIIAALGAFAIDAKGGQVPATALKYQVDLEVQDDV